MPEVQREVPPARPSLCGPGGVCVCVCHCAGPSVGKVTSFTSTPSSTAALGQSQHPKRQKAPAPKQQHCPATRCCCDLTLALPSPLVTRVLVPASFTSLLLRLPPVPVSAWRRCTAPRCVHLANIPSDFFLPLQNILIDIFVFTIFSRPQLLRPVFFSYPLPSLLP